jgi:hypothetical protein
MLRRQDGIALPVAVISMMLVLGLAGVVLTQSIATGDSADREQRSKRALQAADAGLDVATFRADKVATTTNPCPIIGGTGFASYLTIAGEQWCPEVQEDLGDGKSYSYWVSAPAANGDRTVVASGTAEGVTRRVAVVIQKLDQPIVDGYGVSSDSDINMKSSSEIGEFDSPRTRTDVRANGDINMEGSSKVCGNATPGPGQSVNQSGGSTQLCPGYSTAPAPAPITFPEVDDTAASLVNDNARICKPALDPCSPLGDVSPNVWDNANRNLSIGGSATLTLRGSVYYLCSLTMNSSSRLILDPPTTTKPVLIYIGDCVTQPSKVIFINSSAKVESAPGKTVPVQFLVKGSDTESTSVEWHSSSTAVAPTLIYAPKSSVLLDSSSKINGAVVGKDVTLESSAQVIYDARIDINPFDSAVQKTATYRECRAQAATGAVPVEGC